MNSCFVLFRSSAKPETDDEMIIIIVVGGDWISLY